MILITGGAGYIGSHCAMALLKQGKKVHIFDNLSTGHIEIIDILKKCGDLTFTKGDLLNIEDLKKIFNSYNFGAVIHFASYSQVGESVINPEKYYQNNVVGTLNLLNTMIENNVKKIVFSSSAAVYGEPKYIPVDENHAQIPVSPYGKTKLIIENIMDDYNDAYDLKSVRLRYFNVVGADSEAKIGEWHNFETHLVPNILESIFDNSKIFKIYGKDYNTKDGTCIRDYVDVEDITEAHILALNYLNNNGKTDVFNLGSNNGNSVKEVFDMCEKVTLKTITNKVEPRRKGDPEKLIADNTKAKNILAWLPKKGLEDSIISAYNWQCNLQKIKNN